MVKLYDFGVDMQNISANERKAIAWPVAIWSCYIPESEANSLNILEHLILQLVDRKVENIEYLLCKQVGFNEELVGAAISSCNDKGYFDKRALNKREDKRYVLTVDGKSILGKYDNPYDFDLSASKRNKKIYMIQDLVTKSVIPIFDTEKLPDFYVEDNTAIEVHYDNFIGRKPKSASMKVALKYWARLCNNRRMGIVSGSNKINTTSVEESVGTIEEYIPFEDEVVWEEVEETTMTEENQVKTLYNKEAEQEQEEKNNNLANITILDDSPEIYYARGFIALNKNNPDEAIVLSPFGERMDDWFRAVINRLRACDESFEEEILLFLMMKKDELKDIVAFGNDMKIELFDRFPFISNNNEFADLKRAIEALVRTRDRIIDGNDETHNFTENRATALQIALRHVIDRHIEMLQKNISFEDYRMAIKGLVHSYGFDEDIIRNYLSSDKAIYNNMKKCKEGNGHITGYSALFLVDAWKNKDGMSMDMLKAMPEFTEIIYDITRPRNTSTHGNKGKNGEKGYAELYISKDEAIQGYKDFEEIFIALYARFMEGRINGKKKYE